jgi:4-hydroxythreonine-4-phosphate dehydrogenase
MGDPAGIGPEIALKALAGEEVRSLCRPVIYGDVAWLRETAVQLGLQVEIAEARPEDSDLRALSLSDDLPDRTDRADPSDPSDERCCRILYVRQATTADLQGTRLGEVSAQAGKAAAECVIAAARDALSHEIDAIVTGPLNKESITLGGYPYPGHTELLAEVAKTARYGMLLLSGNLRVIHVSTHVSLREAIDRVRCPRILECIRLGSRACQDLGIAAPRVAVAGLNPHAGEHGLFGSEEALEISPAIKLARSESIDATGPHPPDTIFARTLRGEFDLVVAMYHDQGHIPVKLNGFDGGVNVTIGLPLTRVSVDHGTAFDIAGRGIAREESLIEAVRVAVQMVKSKSASLAEPSSARQG